MDLEVDTEWKELAMVVDRLFSIIFFVISSMISLFFMILMPLGAERQLQKILKEEQLIWHELFWLTLMNSFVT